MTYSWITVCKTCLSVLKILALLQSHVHVRKDTRLAQHICVPEQGSLGMRLVSTIGSASLVVFHCHVTKQRLPFVASLIEFAASNSLSTECIFDLN